MGIPSYFSYIVKNHPNIIKKLDTLVQINNFYLDSNSIIYDELRQLSHKFTGDNKSFEHLLINAVISKINEYIEIIQPDGIVIIAFDGVAPLAKLEQQRSRRYKSNLFDQIKRRLVMGSDTHSSHTTHSLQWDKTAITPGTQFMKKLGEKLQKYYDRGIIAEKFGVRRVIVSTSSERGEGEHKIFAYIRKFAKYHKKTTTLIYGLDADLIMLCLNHLRISEQIYLFRETPEFIRSINANLKPNESYFMDIPELANVIVENMHSSSIVNRFNHTIENKWKRLYDYIFICFFLGNDFLPHFPSVNIRTDGIFILINAYKHTIGKSTKCLTDGSTINWTNVRQFVKFLAENELSNLTNEYKKRSGLEKRFYPNKTIKEQLIKLDNIPITCREDEIMIDPFNQNWESRYYKKLFETDRTTSFITRLCVNYMEGLEWVMKYYTVGCPDWRWSYKYHYPPLWNDLLQHIPQWNTVMIQENENKNVSEIVQLSYVLPRSSLALLPLKVKERILDAFPEAYPRECKLHWSFCRYLWESHPALPAINIEQLERLLMPNYQPSN